MDRIAALDIGTNTFRMLIAERKREGKFTPITVEREIVRLGEGYQRSSQISTVAMSRGIKTLHTYIERMRENNVVRCSAVATGVVRRAMNAPEFLRKVEDECGLPVKIISGEEEATLTLKGVELVFPRVNREGTWVIFDIGGGSTELIYGEDRSLTMMESVDLGVVTLSEWISSDLPLKEELGAIAGEIDKVLGPVGEMIRDQSKGKDLFLIGTGGTVTTLAALDQALLVYEPEKVNGLLLKKDSIKATFDHLITLREKEREKLPGLEKGRGKVIIPGCAILLKIMDVFQVGDLWVSDYGLLEGIIIELLESLDSPMKLV